MKDRIFRVLNEARTAANSQLEVIRELIRINEVLKEEDFIDIEIKRDLKVNVIFFDIMGKIKTIFKTVNNFDPKAHNKQISQIRDIILDIDKTLDNIIIDLKKEDFDRRL